jgi:hypothetical protein
MQLPASMATSWLATAFLYGPCPSFSKSASRNREHPRLAIIPKKEFDYRHHDGASNEPDRGRPVIARNTEDQSKTA